VPTHIGDNLFSLDFLKKLCRANEEIECEYSSDFSYVGDSIAALNDFIKLEKKIKISNYEHPEANGLWMHGILPHLMRIKPLNELHGGIHGFPNKQNIFEMMFESGNYVAETLNLQLPYKTLEDVVFDGDVFENNFLGYDVLLVNSYARSSQTHWSEQEQDNYFLNLANLLRLHGIKFITTYKINGFPCTTDKKMNIVDIGRLATKCKVVVGIPTSPFLVSVNELALKKCNVFINIRHQDLNFNFDKFYNLSPYELRLEHIKDFI